MSSRGSTGGRPSRTLVPEKIQRLKKLAGHTIQSVRGNTVTFKSETAMIQALSFLNMLRIIGTISVFALREKLNPPSMENDPEGNPIPRRVEATSVPIKGGRSHHPAKVAVEKNTVKISVQHVEPIDATMIATLGDFSVEGKGEVCIPLAVISAFPNGALISLQRIIE